MAEYQNIFNRVQIRSPAYPGTPLPDGIWKRSGNGFFSNLLGKSATRRWARSTSAMLGLLSPCCAASSPSRSSA